MTTRLRKLIKPPMKMKGISAFFAIVLTIGIFGGIFAFTPLARASAAEKEMPFSMETIAPNEAICVGKIELRSDSVYTINVSAESGAEMFVALNEADDITTCRGIVWSQYTGINGNLIQAEFTGMQTGTFYVYVGSTGQESLTNVNGLLTTDLS